MDELEKKLSDIFVKIAKKETDFWQATDLYFEFSKEVGKTSKEEISDELREKMAKIFIIFVGKNADYCGDLVKGEFRFTNESLDKLEANFKEILEAIDIVHNKMPQIIDADYVARAKEGIKESKELILLGREFASLEDKLKSLKDKENFSWQKVKGVWKEVKEKSSASRSTERLTKTAQIQKWGFLGEIAEPCWEVANAVAKGGKQDIPPEIYPSTIEELNFLQEIADEIPKMIEWLEKEHAGEIKDKDKKIQEIQQKNEALKSFIQQERKKHGYSSSKPTNKPNPQNTQQIQSLQNEINSLTQKITELQNEINELKKQNTNSDQNTNPEIQQKIATLQNQKEQVQKTLKQKQSQQEKIKQRANPQQPNNGFNWLYVVIPGAVLLVVMGIIIAYLIGKKNKRE